MMARLTVSGVLALTILGVPLRMTLGRPVVHLQELLSGLDQPIAVKNAGDGSGRLFVLERAGRIRIIEGGDLRPAPFLDISAQVDVIGEGGLMGLAFHPDFPSNGVFLVNYTASTAGTYRIVVSRFRTSTQSPNQADPAEEVILEIDHQTLIHNGGELAFGPDGYLYISVGDGAFMEQLGDLAQDLSSLSGKILRIDVDQDLRLLTNPANIEANNVPGQKNARGVTGTGKGQGQGKGLNTYDNRALLISKLLLLFNLWEFGAIIGCDREYCLARRSRVRKGHPGRATASGTGASTHRHRRSFSGPSKGPNRTGKGCRGVYGSW